MSRDIPYSRGSSDVGALMIAIFFAAVFLVFFARIQQYEPLRRQGKTTEGRWIDGYTQAQTEHFETIYRFDLGEKSYRGRQKMAPSEYGGDGQPVTVLYLPENPKVSRVLGGEAIQAGDALGLAISLAGFSLSMQHIWAYYRRRPSWVYALRRVLPRLT